MSRPYRKCKVDGCGGDSAKPGSGRGWCGKHYQRFKANGDPLSSKMDRETSGLPCKVDGCDSIRSSRGYCEFHYGRWRRTGDPLKASNDDGYKCRIRWLEQEVTHTGSDCLIWPFPRNDHGRGQVSIQGKVISASRAMCIMAHGDPPSSGHHAAHTCGKGHLGCVHPGHIRWATPAENERDKIEHGTLRRGEKVNTAVLTRADVISIRRRLAFETGARLAAEHGVTTATISAIRSRKTWAWLD